MQTHVMCLPGWNPGGSVTIFFLCDLLTLDHVYKMRNKRGALRKHFFLMRLTGYRPCQFINRNMLNYIVFHSLQITVICINSSIPHMNYMQKEAFYRWGNWNLSSSPVVVQRRSKRAHTQIHVLLTSAGVVSPLRYNINNSL